MINSELLTDDLAEEVAEEVICTCCAEHVEEHIADKIVDCTIKELLDNIMPSVNEIKRLALFEKLFKSLKSYEKQYRTMLATVWEKERKIVVSNIKKMKKAWMSKDKLDEIFYPVGQFEKELSENALEIDLKIIDAQGNATMAAIAGTDVVFDVTNPEVQKWLKTYTPKFSKELEAVNIKILRKELTEGIAAGEGIPQLINRVNKTYANWNKVRSVNIARSETLRASNAGAKFAYLQSGVVEKIVWVTFHDHRTCPWCLQMDGTVIDIKGSFFDLGDTFTVEADDKKQTMDFNYTPIEYPPLHSMCRCSISASFEE